MSDDSSALSNVLSARSWRGASIRACSDTLHRFVQASNSGKIDLEHALTAAAIRTVADVLLNCALTVEDAASLVVGFRDAQRAIINRVKWAAVLGGRGIGLFPERARSGIRRIREMARAAVAAAGSDWGAVEGIEAEATVESLVSIFCAAPENMALSVIWYVLATGETDDASAPIRLWNRDEAGRSSLFKETLRLYPSVWAVDRRAVADDSLEGVHVRRGDVVIVSPYVMHRSGRLWQRPDTFDPARFATLPDHIAAYMPFGHGGRSCMARHVAWEFFSGALGVLSTEFSFVQAPRISRPQGLISLRPADGCRVRLRETSS